MKANYVQPKVDSCLVVTISAIMDGTTNNPTDKPSTGGDSGDSNVPGRRLYV